MISVVIVDDQALIREGLKSLLQLSQQVAVVAECQHGGQLLPWLTAHPEQAQLVLLDLSMPVQDGLATLQQMRDAQMSVPILVLTTFAEPELVLKSIELGAKGFLLKDVALDTLLQAITAVAEGGSWLQPGVTAQLLQQLPQFGSLSQAFSPVTATEPLTEKEREILRLMAAGFSNKEIANALYKSEGTVKNHISNLLAKLGVRDRTRAVLLAIEQQLI